MQITNFKISNDKSKIDVTITDAADITSLYLWTDKTFKDFTLAINLTSKLTSSATETFIITLSDIGITKFDGVYFLEAEDTTEISIAVTEELTRYKECILDKIIELSVCDDCLKKQSLVVTNSHQLLRSLYHAIELKFIDEILLLIKALNKFCSNECKTCGQYENINDNTSQDNNNPDDIDVVIDGGQV